MKRAWEKGASAASRGGAKRPPPLPMPGCWMRSPVMPVPTGAPGARRVAAKPMPSPAKGGRRVRMAVVVQVVGLKATLLSVALI